MGRDFVYLKSYNNLTLENIELNSLISQMEVNCDSDWLSELSEVTHLVCGRAVFGLGDSSSIYLMNFS